MSGRERRRALGFLLAAVLLALCAPAQAQPHATITHKVQEGDTIPLLAVEYYGDRNHAIFILVENGLQHERPLVPGEKLAVPVNREVTVAVGDTLQSLAEQYLGDGRRARFLAEFNQLPKGASLAVGQVIQIPFHVRHQAAGEESIEAIAAGYFRDKTKAALIQAYNFTKTKSLDKGQSIVIPIHHVQVRRSRLPAPDAESQQRAAKRQKTQALAQRILPGARAAWDAGDYAAVKRELTRLDTDYLDTEQAVEAGVLLGCTYVAFADADSALAAFRKVLERSPGHALDAYHYSPKIRAVWKKAGGKVTDKPTGEASGKEP